MRFMLPLYDEDDAAGSGAPAAVVDAPAESESLADHEASFAPGATREPSPEADAADAERGERDDAGRFKPRHRAASQRADADDVPAISEHTKRIKAAEDALGKDIARKPGESERVYNLRRRAEILERRAAEPSPAARREEVPPVERPAPPAPSSDKFPAFVDWIAKPEHADSDYDGYIDARTEHNYAVLRAKERHEESAAAEERTQRETRDAYVEGFAAAREEFPDFDTVLGTLGPQDVSKVVEQAVMGVGAKAAYYLASHRDELLSLTADTVMVSPENPAFKAVVAATRRYISTLVAQQRSPSSRSAAAPTGSAPAPSRPPAPRPPNPVRTGSIAEPDTPPGDESTSIADHEKAFGRRRR